MVEERAKSNFNQEELEEFVLGPETVQRIKMMADFNARHPELSDGFKYYEMSRADKAESWWKKYSALMKDEKMHVVFTQNSEKLDLRFSWSWCYQGLSQLHLHQTMFTTSIKMLGSEKQQKKHIILI